MTTNDFNFTGIIKTDEKRAFSAFAEIFSDSSYSSSSASSSCFLRLSTDIFRQLKSIYGARQAAKIISAAYAFIDNSGDSLLSLAYENKNLEVLNIILSFIFAHGMENRNLYKVLVSPKVLMLNRNIGVIGNFNRQVKSIYIQVKNAKDYKWIQEFKEAYSFIRISRRNYYKLKDKAVTDFVGQERTVILQRQSSFWQNCQETIRHIRKAWA